MLTQQSKRLIILVGITLVGLIGLSIVGCAATPPAAKGTTAMASTKTGNELWNENCAQCHNSRDPAEFSDAQWSVVVPHMALQADLTRPEVAKIVKFLQASN